MSVRGKRNLAGNLVHCWKTWKNLRDHFPGIFSVSDARQNWKAVLLPGRFSHAAAGRALKTEAKIEPFVEGVHKITVLGRGLVFYWLGAVDNNLHYIIDQEFNPRFSHFYTTPPVRLSPESLVIDVGACEGLFAFRVVQQKQASAVICFEPSARNVEFAVKAAQENGVADRVRFETMAVGRSDGQIRLCAEGVGPDGNFVRLASEGDLGEIVDCVSLDNYCRRRAITLSRRDLIKIDAEGSDLDVLLGAEQIIRNAAPQIAVTTYHKPEHATQIVGFLKSAQPDYRFRLKGFSWWTPLPNPVLLQASAL